MIKNTELNTISIIASKYKIKEILLFGSSLENDTYNDIDLGILGIDPVLFFKFYGDLIKNLNIPLDIVDLSDKSSFTEMIKKYGKIIYANTE
ncbi:MAG: hypothetical protein PF638_08310 [Candidatus Delongbacteria bacterium]|jgi:predicted nucleotidyltransferase|nr:hypothetical protein [Candidatus Delongbacteria bacterium]